MVIIKSTHVKQASKWVVESPSETIPTRADKIGTATILSPQLAAVNGRVAFLCGIACCSNRTQHPPILPHNSILSPAYLPSCFVRPHQYQSSKVKKSLNCRLDVVDREALEVERNTSHANERGMTTFCADNKESQS